MRVDVDVVELPADGPAALNRAGAAHVPGALSPLEHRDPERACVATPRGRRQSKVAAMKIRTGFDIAFTLSQPTPMILMLSVHPARIEDLLTPQAIRFDPPVEAREYRDVFDNICHRIVAPPGQLTIAADFTVQDSGQPDPVVP